MMSINRIGLVWSALIAAVGLAAPSAHADTRDNGSAPYPATRAAAIAEPHFGETIADPYRWLENDVREDGEVRAWVEAQNKVSQAYLATLPGRDALAERMRAITNFERFGTPRKGGNRYFYSRNDGLQNQSALWVREGAEGKPRLLLDPNTWAADGATALAEWMPSPDGRLLLYAIQDGGSDWRTLRVLDVATGEVLGSDVKWVKFATLAWLKDGSGYFYSRFPEPDKAETFQASNLNHSVWFHRVGSEQREDVLVYATPARPRLDHRAEVTDDGRWLLIRSSEGTDERYELHVARLDGRWPLRVKSLVRRLEHDWQLAGSVDDRLWFLTNLNAPRGRLVTLDAARRRLPPVEIVPQSEDILVGASMVGQRLILAYLGDAKSEAELRELDGRLVSPIQLPGIGTAAGFGGSANDPETFYSFSGFATAPTIYRLNTQTAKADIFAQPRTAFDPKDFRIEQQFYTSKDGTRIPMFLVRRKDVSGPAPTLLYGYGGFNIPQTPGFNAQRLAWVDAGGVLAMANLRGGGEYGKAWHDAGRLERKQNVFDDFIAAGEYLIAQGIAKKDGLAIEGRSNGGLLIGAVVNQRPDLFAAALPVVGVMDMLRFNRFTAGRYWVDDYGDPGKEADFRVLRSYSPYHNIMGGKRYPAILVMTADTDDRVVPGHSFKYAAALQAADTGDRPKLIRIDTRAGHGSGKPVDKLIAEYADAYAFLAHWTGLKLNSVDNPPGPVEGMAASR